MWLLSTFYQAMGPKSIVVAVGGDGMWLSQIWTYNTAGRQDPIAEPILVEAVHEVHGVPH